MLCTQHCLLFKINKKKKKYLSRLNTETKLQLINNFFYCHIKGWHQNYKHYEAILELCNSVNINHVRCLLKSSKKVNWYLQAFSNPRY